MTRVQRHARASAALGRLSDDELAALVEAGTPLATGIGGVSLRVDVDEVPVFVKRVPLTALEAEHPRSTGNLFELPTFYQYGVGSAGFGVWRELAAHEQTTAWVLSGETHCFPLLHHWRVLPSQRPATDQAELDKTVAYWEGSAAVRHRLEQIEASTTDVVLFLELFPGNAADWLDQQHRLGGEALAAALTMLERELLDGTKLLRAKGMLHLDAHLHNLLTEGDRLYFGDLGLATSTGFDLSPAEWVFVEDNQRHDEVDVMRQLVNWLVVTFDSVATPAERNARIREVSEGRPAVGPGAGIVERYAPEVAVLNDFYWALRTETKTAPFPFAELNRLAQARFGP